ncbi:hypothetical protein DL95DRAFT_116926 [Leptodontidium sp. 2 PMI_412]|nr:hypothetical protein DL95DRAFT_116926 [Leptodontidium sp. 2 PMI_412]
MTRLSQKRTMPFEEGVFDSALLIHCAGSKLSTDLSFILAEAVLCHASSGERVSRSCHRLWTGCRGSGMLGRGLLNWASSRRGNGSTCGHPQKKRMLPQSHSVEPVVECAGRCCSERFVVVDQAFLLHSMDWTILLSSLKQEECSEDRSRSEMKSDMNGGTGPDEMVKWKSGRYRQSRLSSRLTVSPAFARLHGGFVDSLCLDSFALRLTPCSSSHRLSGPRARTSSMLPKSQIR